MRPRRPKDDGAKPPTGPENTGARGKAALRRELENATQRYLQQGGVVKDVPAGASAWEIGTRPPPSRPIFTEPANPRTPVGDVVARLEARREAMKAKRRPKARSRTQRARRRIIYDDFGEPLRRVWDED
jgi:hypothetical protein